MVFDLFTLIIWPPVLTVWVIQTFKSRFEIIARPEGILPALKMVK
jgi:hypothetical protein